MIKTIIPSVNFSDFLNITLVRNKKAVNNIIVVTSSEDKLTIEVAKKNNIVPYLTDAFYIFYQFRDFYNGKKIFNRSLVINLILQQLKEQLDWVLLLDSDIILPNNFERNFLETNPDIEYFFGCRRRNIETLQDLIKFETNQINISPYRGSGYGFFQLFNINSKIYKNLFEKTNGFPYPMTSPNVCEDDWKMRNFWGERVFNPPLGKFPECHSEPNNDYDIGLYKELPMIVNHLGFPGLNHNDRITPKFQ